MVSCRSASLMSSSAGTGRCLPACDPPEDGTDGEPETGQVAAPEDVAGHHLARCEDVRGAGALAEEDAGLLVYRHAHIGKGDAGPQRVAVERRLRDRDRPVALGRI